MTDSVVFFRVGRRRNRGRIYRRSIWNSILGMLQDVVDHLETEYRREPTMNEQLKGTKGDAGEHGAGDQEMIGVLRVESARLLMRENRVLYLIAN